MSWLGCEFIYFKIIIYLHLGCNIQFLYTWGVSIGSAQLLRTYVSAYFISLDTINLDTFLKNGSTVDETGSYHNLVPSKSLYLGCIEALQFTVMFLLKVSHDC